MGCNVSSPKHSDADAQRVRSWHRKALIAYSANQPTDDETFSPSPTDYNRSRRRSTSTASATRYSSTGDRALITLHHISRRQSQLTAAHSQPTSRARGSTSTAGLSLSVSLGNDSSDLGASLVADEEEFPANP